MFEPPEGVTDPFWVCQDCGIALPGPHEEAAKHFDEDWEKWSHWLYEFAFTNGRYPHHPTGWEMHTSDGGGYYRTHHDVKEVYKRFTQMLVNEIIRPPAPKPPTGKFFLNGFVAHAVKESAGEQGRVGQVVAYCGFGRVDPAFLDVLDSGLHILCKVCEVRMPNAGT